MDNIRLIDANALKRDFIKDFYNAIGNGESAFDVIGAMKKAIDNAPTVEYTFEEAFQKTVCEQKLYCPKRPKGKWKETGYETGALGITYRQTQCSNCGWEHALPMWWNFCPNCGADMRGEKE